MVPALHVEVLAVPWHGSSNTDHSHDHTISDSPKIAGAYESELNGEIFHELNSNRPPEASGNGIREDSSLSPHSEQNHTNNSESSSITDTINMILKLVHLEGNNASASDNSEENELHDMRASLQEHLQNSLKTLEDQLHAKMDTELEKHHMAILKTQMVDEEEKLEAAAMDAAIHSGDLDHDGMVDKEEAKGVLHSIFGGDTNNVPNGLESLHLSEKTIAFILRRLYPDNDEARKLTEEQFHAALHRQTTVQKHLMEVKAKIDDDGGIGMLVLFAILPISILKIFPLLTMLVQWGFFLVLAYSSWYEYYQTLRNYDEAFMGADPLDVESYTLTDQDLCPNDYSGILAPYEGLSGLALTESIQKYMKYVQVVSPCSRITMYVLLSSIYFPSNNVSSKLLTPY